MKTVNSLISGILKDLGMEDRIKIESIRGEWRKLFNEPLSLHTWPVELNGGELLINVDSPVWLQQLKFFKQDITKKLASFDVKSVKFKHGSVYRERVSSKKTGTVGQSRPRKNISDSDREWIEQTVSIVADDEVRESIRKAIEEQLRRKV